MYCSESSALVFIIGGFFVHYVKLENHKCNYQVKRKIFYSEGSVQSFVSQSHKLWICEVHSYIPEHVSQSLPLLNLLSFIITVTWKGLAVPFRHQRMKTTQQVEGLRSFSLARQVSCLTSTKQHCLEDFRQLVKLKEWFVPVRLHLVVLIYRHLRYGI